MSNFLLNKHSRVYFLRLNTSIYTPVLVTIIYTVGVDLYMVENKVLFYLVYLKFEKELECSDVLE